MIRSPFIVDVADLFGRDAPSRDVSVEAPVDWALELSRIEPDPPLRADLTLSPLPGGILARGALRFRVEHSCRRCLSTFSEDVSQQVTALFEDGPEGDAYPIDGADIDVEQFLRDEALLSLPMLPECPDGCTVVVSRQETDLNTELPGDAADSPFAVLRDLLPPAD